MTKLYLFFWYLYSCLEQCTRKLCSPKKNEDQNYDNQLSATRFEQKSIIVQNRQDIVQNRQEIVQNRQEIVQNRQRIVKTEVSNIKMDEFSSQHKQNGVTFIKKDKKKITNLQFQQELSNQSFPKINKNQKFLSNNQPDKLSRSQGQIQSCQDVKINGFRYSQNQNLVSLSKKINNHTLVLAEAKIEIIIPSKTEWTNDTIIYEYYYDKFHSLNITKKQVSNKSNGQKTVTYYHGLSNSVKDTQQLALEPQQPLIVENKKSQTKPMIQILNMIDLKTNHVTKYESQPDRSMVSLRDNQGPQEIWVRYNQSISRSILKSCEKGQWLSNEIINVFTRHMNKENSQTFWKEVKDQNNSIRRVYAFDVDSLGLLLSYDKMTNMTMKKDGLDGIWQRVLALGKYIFDIYDVIFFPINKNNIHWYLMSARRVQGQFLFEIYDSLRGGQLDFQNNVYQTLLNFFSEYGLINAEQRQHCQLQINTQCAQQPNGYDCGVYVCKFIQSITLQMSVRNIQQQRIDQMRSFLKDLISCKEKQ